MGLGKQKQQSVQGRRMRAQSMRAQNTGNMRLGRTKCAAQQPQDVVDGGARAWALLVLWLFWRESMVVRGGVVCTRCNNAAVMLPMQPHAAHCRRAWAHLCSQRRPH